MKYKVVKLFTDLQDNNYAYHVGDSFPREGLTVTAERLDELSSNENKQGVPLIEKVFEEEKPKKPAKGKKEKVNKNAE